MTVAVSPINPRVLLRSTSLLAITASPITLNHANGAAPHNFSVRL
jgi:hypothetical protein